jgi:cell shape-determining protein MreC
MNRQRSNTSALIPIVLGISVLFLLLSLAAQAPISQGPLSVVLGPLQRSIAIVGQRFGEFTGQINEGGLSAAEARTLRDQLAAVSSENVRLREFQAETLQLRELLQFTRDNPALTFVGADVIGAGASSAECEGRPRTGPDVGACVGVIAGDPSPYTRYVTINAGRVDGLAVGMPVIGSGGALLGRVGTVNERTAQVQLLNDPSSFVNVQLVGTRATGSVSGMSDGTLRLQNVSQTDELQAGDLIVTSGLGGALPPGLTVGQVDRIVSADADTLKSATVRPVANLTRVEFLIVVKFVPPT